MVSPRIAIWCRVDGEQLVVDVDQGFEASVDILLAGARIGEFALNMLIQR